MPQNASNGSTDTTGHDHSGLDVPGEDGARFGAPAGERVNGDALVALVGAAFDACVPCQRAGLDAVQTDALTLTRLVELSAIAMQAIAGGLPDPMLTETGKSSLSAGYRAMLRAGADREDHAPMYAAAVALGVAERRRVAEDALDMLIGVLPMGA